MTSSNYEELCIYNVIPKATTKKAMQRDTKILYINQKVIIKTVEG